MMAPGPWGQSWPGDSFQYVKKGVGEWDGNDGCSVCLGNVHGKSFKIVALGMHLTTSYKWRCIAT